MKGIILAGGLGTRLRPLTLTTNKHLLPVHDRPMIHYPLRSLVEGGIREVVIVTGTAYLDEFRRSLESSREFGLSRLDFAGQQGEGGIADALKAAEPFARGGRMCVILGDNIVERSIRGPAERFAAQKSGARLMLKRVEDARGFGVARVENGRIVEIVEKPDRPTSNLAVTGIYFYDETVFDICRSLRPSARGELEITDVNLAYLRRGDLEWEELEGWWIDAGTIESLEWAAHLVESNPGIHC